jgi:elongation factor G
MNMGLNRNFYRATVQHSGVGEGRIIRRRDGIDVYAYVRVEVRALGRGEGTIFAWNAGLQIPAKFVRAVSEGIQDALTTLDGLELTDIRTSVEDGSYHDQDSTADAFREAAEEASREAVQHASPMILEAWSLVTITVPENFAAAATATVKSYEGEVSVARAEEQSRTLVANVPSRNLSELIAELLRLSDGRARISSCHAGFRFRPEPPDDVEQWVRR